MGLFGALFTSVSGTQAQSQQTAMISDNIANVSTVGHKRTDASFRSLVTTQTNSGRFSSGSVISDRQLRATEQGALRQTNSATDVAVSGNGFFIIRQDELGSAGGGEFLYSRNGEFFENEQGFLQNTAGFILYGVPIVTEGVTPDFSDLSQLVAVDATTISQNARQTSDAELAINLDSTTSSYNNDIDPPGAPTSLPVPIAGDTGVASDFTRTLRVFDSLGAPQDLVLDFRKVLGPSANATFSIQNIELDDVLSGTSPANGALEGIEDGDTITLTTIAEDGTGENSITVQFESDPTTSPAAAGNIVVTTLQDFMNAINDGTNGLEIRQNSNDELILQATNPTDSIEISATSPTALGNPLGTLGFNLVQDANQFVEKTGATFLDVGGNPDATALLSSAAGITNGEQIDLSVSGSVPAGAQTVTIAAVAAAPATVATAQDLIDYVNGTGIFGPTPAFVDAVGDQLLRAEFNADTGQIDFIRRNSDSTFAIADAGLGTSASGADSLAVGTSVDFVFEPEAPVDPTDSADGTAYGVDDPYPDQADFPSFANTGDNVNSQGWWEVTITQPNGNIETRGLINFNSDATLNANANANDETVISLQDIQFTGTGAEPQDIDIDISRFSSFAGANNVIFSDQNGAEVGLRTGVEISDEGVVVARFSNGTTAELFQIPLATFANPNGLNPVSGTAFSETEESGQENLNAPGAGGAGILEPSALEQSNVDLADEFAKLIVSQRAFTSNTRTLNTVDEMLEDLLRLR